MNKTSVAFILMTGILLSSCSSGPDVKQQAYAKLKNDRTFEYDLPTVWKGIEETVRKYKVLNRDPKDADAVEMKKLRERKLETDWIFSKSNDKYIEYKVNDLPRKIYLQTRLKYVIDAKTVIGGVDVNVKTTEEVERLKDDGSPNGWDSDDADSSRASDLLDRINMAILSLPP